MRNPFTRLKQLEARVENLEQKNENLYGLVVALARVSMIHPSLLAEKYNQPKENIQYLVQMGK